MALSASALNLPNVVRCYTDGMWSLTSLTADGSSYGMLSMLGSEVNLTATKNLYLTCSNQGGSLTLSSNNQIQLTATNQCTLTCSSLSIQPTYGMSVKSNTDMIVSFSTVSALTGLGVAYTTTGYASPGAYILGTGGTLVFDTPSPMFKVNGTQYMLYFQNGYVRYYT